LSRRPKVLFISADNAGCGFWRMYLPALHLLNRGLCEARIRNGSLTEDDLEWCDAVVLQRYRKPCDSVWWELDKRNVAIIIENDDRYDLVPPHSCWKKPWPHDEVAAVGRCVALADAAFTTTPQLAGHWAKFNEHVYALPNSTDLRVAPIRKTGDMFSLRPEFPTDGFIRIGWTASPHHAVDWHVVKDAIAEIGARYINVAFSFMGWMPDDIKKLVPDSRIERRGWTPIKKYLKSLREMRWDIGIAPLQQCEFNDAKSELKAVEYGMLGIPCVVSPSAPYERIVARGAPHVFLAKNYQNWVAMLDWLITDEAARRDAGAAGRSFVEEHYDISKNVELWRDAIVETIERPRNARRAEAYHNMKAMTR